MERTRHRGIILGALASAGVIVLIAGVTLLIIHRQHEQELDRQSHIIRESVAALILASVDDKDRELDYQAQVNQLQERLRSDKLLRDNSEQERGIWRKISERPAEGELLRLLSLLCTPKPGESPKWVWCQVRNFEEIGKDQLKINNK